MIDEIMKIMLADYKDDIKPQYYEWIVRCMIENDNKESAKEWCELADKNLQGLLSHTSVILDIIIIAMMAQIL